MSLCLSANAAPSAPTRRIALGDRLRRLTLSFSKGHADRDMLPAPSAERVAALGARRPATPHRAAGQEINALLL